MHFNTSNYFISNIVWRKYLYSSKIFMKCDHCITLSYILALRWEGYPNPLIYGSVWANKFSMILFLHILSAWPVKCTTQQNTTSIIKVSFQEFCQKSNGINPWQIKTSFIILQQPLWGSNLGIFGVFWRGKPYIKRYVLYHEIL